MTRRSITAVLASLLVALFVTVQSAAASIVPSTEGSPFNYRVREENTTTLPSAAAPATVTVAPTAMTMNEWRFWEMNLLLPGGQAKTYMEDLTPAPSITGTPR